MLPLRATYGGIGLKLKYLHLIGGLAMRKSHVVCAVLIAVLVSCGLSFAETDKEFNDKGEAAYKAKDYAKAVEYYTEVLNLEPNRHETIYARGVNYYKLKKYDDALVDFIKVKDVKKIDHHALNYIGLIYMAKEDYPAAFNAFKGAVDLEPKGLLYCLNAARASVKTRDRLIAMRYYKWALQIDPKNKEAITYLDSRVEAFSREKKQEEGNQATALPVVPNPAGLPPILGVQRCSRPGGFLQCFINPLTESMWEIFRYAYANNIRANVVMGYLEANGVNYHHMKRGGGDLLNSVYYNLADNYKELFFVAFDDNFRIGLSGCLSLPQHVVVQLIDVAAPDFVRRQGVYCYGLLYQAIE